MTKRTLDSVIDIPTFQKYWIYDRPYGHDIVIAAETDRKRGPMGRVSRKNAEITK